MKIRDKNRFQVQGPAASEAAQATTAAQGAAQEAAPIDGREAPRVSLAALTGAVQSRHSYAEVYRTAYVAPQPNVVQVDSTIKVEELQKGLADARIPVGKMNVTLNGNTITVDGLSLTYQATANGIQITGRAVNLTQQQVAAAVRKLAAIATTAKTLGFIDQNAQLYGTPQVTLLPDGRLTIGTVAAVRVNPKLGSQAQAVLDQHKGGLQMPEVKAPSGKKAGKRTQLVG